MRNKLGVICMSLGAVLIFAALSLCLLNYRESNLAETQAEAVVLKLEEQLREPESSPDISAPEAGEDLPDPFDPTMTEVEIDGYLYVGTLDIPALELSLPVMSTWSYPQLKIAPCRYSGSSKTDDLVIAAHNYASHFGKIKNLSEGDWVYFTDMDGVITKYAVSAVEVLQPTAMEEMSAGEYDLTLFTCTYDSQKRVTIRCDRVKN